jgi:hypothetical protein
MKNLFIISAFALSAITFVACNNSSKTAISSASDSASPAPVANADHTNAPKAGVDPKIAASIKDLLTNYLDLKNGLVKDDGKEAAEAGKALMASLEKVDHSAMTPEQMKSYTDIADDAKEMAEHISKNEDKIEHQREHFDMLSKDMIDLVKVFGAGETVYIDHCPMYNEKKGAMWLSEIKEIKNPYMGSSMSTCGIVKEKLN